MKYKVNVSAEAKRLIANQVHFIAIENGEPQVRLLGQLKLIVQSLHFTLCRLVVLSLRKTS